MASDVLDRELAGIDALEAMLSTKPSRARRAWSATWPKVAAVLLFFAVWQLVVWTGWKPEYLLHPPGDVLRELGDLVGTERFWSALRRTLQRAVLGYALAVVIGTAIGIAVARIRVLRTAVGSMITGIQTMPSVVWFPLAIVLFGLDEPAIMFVVVLGAAPSIANGVIAGVDHVPPLLLRSGRMLGARGLATYRHVVLPAALPTFVSGLKQGWAFSWRSLMAGEIITTIPGKPGIGSELEFARTFGNYELLLAWMMTIFVIGVLIDVLFGKADLTLRRRWGLVEGT